MIVRKGNKQITIESDLARDKYLAQGFDEVNEKGEVVRKATAGKAVTAAELDRAVSAVKADYEARMEKQAGEHAKAASAARAECEAQLAGMKADYEARIAKLEADNAKLKKKLKDPAAEAAE